MGTHLFISEYLKGAETLQTREAELLKNKKLPIEQYSPDRDAGVVYLHSDENPFGGYERIAKDLRGQPRGGDYGSCLRYAREVNDKSATII
jgi:hypothetical protein